MSKFCSKCGAQIDDAAAFCEKCGAAVSANTSPAPAVEQPQQTPAPVAQQPAPAKAININSDKLKEFAKKNKKTAIIAIAAILVIVIAIVSLTTLPNFIGYKNTTRKALNAVLKEDKEAFIDLTSEIYSSGYGGYLFEDVTEDISAFFKNKKMGNYELNYTIKSNKKMSERRFEELLDNIAKNSSYDDEAITDGRIVKGKFKATPVKIKKEKSYSLDYEMWIIKEEDGWRIYRFYVDYDADWDDDDDDDDDDDY